MCIEHQEIISLKQQETEKLEVHIIIDFIKIALKLGPGVEKTAFHFLKSSHAVMTRTMDMFREFNSLCPGVFRCMNRTVVDHMPFVYPLLCVTTLALFSTPDMFLHPHRALLLRRSGMNHLHHPPSSRLTSSRAVCTCVVFVCAWLYWCV